VQQVAVEVVVVVVAASGADVRSSERGRGKVPVAEERKEEGG
jgi:hypothetical protein